MDRSADAEPAMLRLVVESAPSALILVDAKGSILLVNRQTERLFGYTRTELQGKLVDMLVPERFRGRHPGMRGGYLASPSERAMGAGRDLYGLRKDGCEVPVEIGLTPIQMPEGVGVLAAVIDISERKRLEQARRESEQRYADLVEQAVDGIVVRRQDGGIVFVNDALCGMLGYSRQELLSMDMTSLVDPEDQYTLQQAEGLRAFETAHFERRLHHKDGRIIPAEVSAHRLKNGDIQNILHDVSQRKQAERALQDSEAHFRLVVESTPNALVMVDAQGTITLVNSQTEELFGYRREELLGKSVDMLVPRRSRPGHADLRRGFTVAPAQRAMGAGRDLHGLRKDGREVPIEIGLNPVTTGDGTWVLASIINISERRRAEQALRDSEMLFRSLVEATTQAVWVAEPDGTVSSMSNTFEQFTGIPFGPDFSPRWTEAIHPEERQLVWDAWRLATERGDIFAMEYRLRMQDGFYRCVAAYAVPISAPGKPVEKWIGTLTDIQDRKDREEYLRTLPQHLLEAQETERRRIARELHDEVGQALTASQIKLRDLELQLQDTPRVHAVTDISAIIGTLLHQVRQMSLDLRPSVLDDLGLVPAMRWFLRERMGQSGIEVGFESAADLPRHDPAIETTLFRVFQSALTNVLRHSGAKQVTVSLRLDHGRLALEIRDDGRGFDLVAARRRAKAGGSLGLLGIEEWVRLSGGDIMIETGPGRGTRVYAAVPVR